MRIEKCEVMYTSFLSEALDYFMRGVGHCCLHQCHIYNGSILDFYMALLNNNDIPHSRKLIADFKIVKFDKAKAQSFHYCMAQDKASYPILTMPCTSEKFEMHLCIPKSQGQMAYIKIMEAQVDHLIQSISILIRFHMQQVKNQMK